MIDAVRKTIATLGSLAAHGVVGLAIGLLYDPDPVARSTAKSGSVELVDIEAPTRSGGGGSPTAGTPTKPRAIPPVRHPHIDRGPTRSEDGTAGGETGIGGGLGTGIGSGLGGIGLGTGTKLELPDLPPPPPPPPPAEVPRVSLARPAKLIYPSREREVEDGRLFVARVVVDRDGFVVGAKLVRGYGGRGDNQAADLIWRFRYAPALDDAGQAIRSTLDQRFMVQ